LISFSATMDRPSEVDVTTEGDNVLVLSGKTSDFEQVKGNVQFEARVRILTTGGTVSSADTAVNVAGADIATDIYFNGIQFQELQ